MKRLEEQYFKLEVSMTDKVSGIFRLLPINFIKIKYEKLCKTFYYTLQEENKEIALGTSKLNYLDPRISIAW